ERTIRAAPPTVGPLRSMMAQVGISPHQYTVVNLPSEVAAFTSGQVPVWSAYATNFSTTLQNAGFELNFIFSDDYADTLYTTDRLIAENPDLVRRFLRAALEGWTYVAEHAADSGLLVSKYDPAADRVLETAKMVASLPLIDTGEDHIGWMKPEMWAGMEKSLRETGMLTRTLAVSEVYTLQFLREIYGN
ncbi:MAG: ABC transporter substrate-binding protein, partial [Dehalococcoidia bacterium]|nr:ABC transporter substrate-binding protein [Dehalococcoidia bacterium]